MELRLRGKSTSQSHGAPIFYADLRMSNGTEKDQALQAANEPD